MQRATLTPKEVKDELEGMDVSQLRNTAMQRGVNPEAIKRATDPVATRLIDLIIRTEMGAIGTSFTNEEQVQRRYELRN